MRVYVSQGHEQGIGLEVFFKSCLLLKKSDLEKITLIGFKDSVERTLKSIRHPFTIYDDSVVLSGTRILALWQNELNHSESFTSLKVGMKLAEEGGVLFTLPTSKDQFPGFPGHTEYFRSHYKQSDLGMYFSSPKLQVLLLSDHVPVNALSEIMTEELIYTRLKTAIESLQKWSWPIPRVIVSGMNPHAGENGLIGHEDMRIKLAVKRIKSELKIEMSGPLPGDTMVLEQKSIQDILVYVFHDQGLGVFKGLQGFIGSNITLGLPYPRFSPDHGTSFNLFEKNQADYRGCSYALNEALKILKKVSNGKNSSHKSKSS